VCTSGRKESKENMQSNSISDPLLVVQGHRMIIYTLSSLTTLSNFIWGNYRIYIQALQAYSILQIRPEKYHGGVGNE
jgi:hypothetical protein